MRWGRFAGAEPGKEAIRYVGAMQDRGGLQLTSAGPGGGRRRGVKQGRLGGRRMRRGSSVWREQRSVRDSVEVVVGRLSLPARFPRPTSLVAIVQPPSQVLGASRPGGGWKAGAAHQRFSQAGAAGERSARREALFRAAVAVCASPSRRRNTVVPPSAAVRES